MLPNLAGGAARFPVVPRFSSHTEITMTIKEGWSRLTMHARNMEGLRESGNIKFATVRPLSASDLEAVVPATSITLWITYLNSWQEIAVPLVVTPRLYELLHNVVKGS